jgi:hypothetical protein
MVAEWLNHRDHMDGYGHDGWTFRGDGMNAVATGGPDAEARHEP